MTPEQGDTIVVWFSCGAASAVAARKAIEQYSHICTIRIVNNPIKEEDADNQRFLKEIERWLGLPIESQINPKYPNHSCVEVWNKEKYMSGVGGARCTRDLKKAARQEWEKNNHFDFIVMGFTAEERSRYERFVRTERSNTLNILGDLGLSKQDCFDIILSAGIELPLIYKLGYPNANCIGCVKSSSPTYWNHVRAVHPDVFKERAEQSRRIGCRLVKYKGKRIFLDELPPDAKGRPMASLKMPDCGIFCEEKY
ncbi:hypothetical protein [Arachidicoccus terrestris]|uniref:hypothetical protein n=1 Tax=Arachidicoccus terrestris TaxID=2875539 RepID=UPI001CC66FC4|nr:hypothetical protein [Arachidicoccus terrestris]UAY56248.1 hypothetical protein K9M52_04310 [Arachidicoccus terrestris]